MFVRTLRNVLPGNCKVLSKIRHRTAQQGLRHETPRVTISSVRAEVDSISVSETFRAINQRRVTHDMTSVCPRLCPLSCLDCGVLLTVLARAASRVNGSRPRPPLTGLRLTGLPIGFAPLTCLMCNSNTHTHTYRVKYTSTHTTKCLLVLFVIYVFRHFRIACFTFVLPAFVVCTV